MALMVQSISALVKNSVLSSSPTLVSLSPLPLLGLVTSAAEQSPSGIWFSLASTLVLRVNSPPSFLTKKRGRSAQIFCHSMLIFADRTTAEEEMHKAEDLERWNAIGDAGSRLVIVASRLIDTHEGMKDVSRCPGLEECLLTTLAPRCC